MLGLWPFYELTPRDAGNQNAVLVTWSASETSAFDGHILILGTVPDGRVLLVESGAMLMQPGAAQYPHECRLGYSGNGRSSRFLAGSPGHTTAAVDFAIGRPLQGVLVPDGCVVSAQLEYNAGAAANTSWAWLTGWLLPKGNLAT